jgi:hypothetical protein
VRARYSARAHLEKARRGAQRAELGQVAASLPHGPAGRARHGLAAQGAQHDVVRHWRQRGVLLNYGGGHGARIGSERIQKSEIKKRTFLLFLRIVPATTPGSSAHLSQ